MEIKISPAYERKLKRLIARYNVDEHKFINGLLGNHFIAMNKSKSKANKHHLQVQKFVLGNSLPKKQIWDDFVEYCKIIHQGAPEKTSMFVLGEILIWEKDKHTLIVGTDNDIYLGEIEKIAKAFNLNKDCLSISYFQRTPRFFNICIIGDRDNE